MPTRLNRRAQIAHTIRLYLTQHPNASDTVEGIHMWWLPSDWQVDENDVLAALIELQQDGVVSQHKNLDNHVLFCAGINFRRNTS